MTKAEPTDPALAEDAPKCSRRCLRITRDGICDRCYALTRRDLADLPGLYVELHVRRAPGQGSGEAPVSGTRDRPIGLREDVHDHMALILDQLAGWSQVVTEERRLAGPRTGPTRRAGRFVVDSRGGTNPDRRPDRDQAATQVVVLSEFLLTHAEWSSRQLWADDWSGEVRELADVARRLAGLYDPMPRRVPGVACPRCGVIALMRWPKEMHDEPARVECGACGTRYLPDDERLQQATREAARSAREAGASPVSRLA